MSTVMAVSPPGRQPIMELSRLAKVCRCMWMATATETPRVNRLAPRIPRVSWLILRKVSGVQLLPMP